MEFYKEIVHKLYVWNTKIGETDFDPFDFIEAQHNEAPYKGKVFYQNLIREMPNHFGAKMRNDFFIEILEYCNKKIIEVTETKNSISIKIDPETKGKLATLRLNINKLENYYKSELESIKYYLQYNGRIIPKDFTDFFFWLLLEKYKQENLIPLPKITDFDFIEYSNYREYKLSTGENLTKPHIETETKAEYKIPAFTNNFDNINPIEIYKHFKAGLVDKGYLTELELNEYLKAAFELKTKPETLFKLKYTPTKQKIYTVFYIYYKDISQKKHERQKEYAALLGDFFEGYKTKIIQTNWARDYQTKR